MSVSHEWIYLYVYQDKREGGDLLPMALHPELRSFDLHLNGLLANKVDLSDAVVTADTVGADDLQGCFR